MAGMYHVIHHDQVGMGLGIKIWDFKSMLPWMGINILVLPSSVQEFQVKMQSLFVYGVQRNYGAYYVTRKLYIYIGTIHRVRYEL